MSFTYRNGEEADHYSILESLGGGVALLDYDADGRVDLLIPGGGGFGPGPSVLGLPAALYRQMSSGRFQDESRSAQVDLVRHYSHGAAVADFDHDGFPDVLITGYGGLLFFQNQGDGTFRENTENALFNDRLWSSSAAWGDLNGDGHLDVYVAHYVNWSWENNPYCKGVNETVREVCPPRDFKDLPDTVYYSNGDGTFQDASKLAGLAPDGRGLGVVIADLDLDGQSDIYVANDEVPNFLYHNRGNGRFAEIGDVSGTSVGAEARPEGSMGVDVGDYNGDGLPDIFVANYEGESAALYRNDGERIFTHVSQGTGITAVHGLYVGWGSIFFDCDHDGDEDIFISNGHVFRKPVNSPLHQKPILFENKGGKRFVNVASEAGPYCQNSHMGRGVAVGDLDRDGDLDLVVAHTNQPVALLMNETESEADWLSLRLIGTKSNRDAIGAVVFLETTSGRQMRQVKGGGSYASTNDLRVHFGLGEAEFRKLEIRWPSGKTQTIQSIALNQMHTIVEQE